MGWTSYHATHYDKRGKVDRKAEVESQFDEDIEVLKSTMVGSTYYGAVRWKGSLCIWGIVVLTSTDAGDYYNFSYKDMDETCGPCYYDCPKGILDLLTATDSEYANAWREKCYELNEKKSELKKLKLGSKIRVNEKVYTLQKHGWGARKPSMWINWESRSYVKSSDIIRIGYEVVERK